MSLNTGWTILRSEVFWHVDPLAEKEPPVTVSSFTPKASFRGTGFNDVNRGFMASTNVTSRLSHTMTIDSSKGTIQGGNVTTSGTHWNGIPVGNAENFTSEAGVDKIFTSKNNDNSTMSYDAHFTGSDPIGLELAPEVEARSSVSLTENLKKVMLIQALHCRVKTFGYRSQNRRHQRSKCLSDRISSLW